VYIVAITGRGDADAQPPKADKGGALGLQGGGLTAAARARRKMRRCSSLAWNPEVATQLLVACEDDLSPTLQMWDLRNSVAPLRELNGHDKARPAAAGIFADRAGHPVLGAYASQCSRLCTLPTPRGRLRAPSLQRAALA